VVTDSIEARGAEQDRDIEVMARAAVFPRTAARASVDHQPGDLMTVARAWHDLVEDLEGDERAVERFATIWLDLLPRRLAACRRALVAGDDDTARVRLLTLHSSAAMLGLDRFAKIAWRCQDALDASATGTSSARHLARDMIAEAQVSAGLVRTVLSQARWSKR